MAHPDDAKAISRAFYDAEKRRPYQLDEGLIKAATPPGGDWSCEAALGSVTRSVVWQGREVALVNPRGDLDDSTEGQIAMAMASLPTMDAALRSIIVLAETTDNLDLIRALAIAVIAHVERPAPAIPEPDDDEEAG